MAPLSPPPSAAASRGSTSRVRRWIALALVALCGPSCSHLLPTPTPLRTSAHPANPSSRANTLVVFLPGRGDSKEDFKAKGLLSQLSASGVEADVVAVDAHLGYYFKRSIIDRLSEDVIEPARQQGYRRIVVVGISLGGLGALLLERDRPGSVYALVLLSPYLGDRKALLEEIRAAGGAEKWAAGRPLRSGEVQDEIWTFLGQRAHTLPPTWLLTGEKDRLLPGQRLLAGLLPPENVRITDGAHKWATWRALWKHVCDDSRVFEAERHQR